MRQTSLCWRWVIVLVLKMSRNERVRASLTKDDLPCPSDDDLNAVRAALPRAGSKQAAERLEQLGIAGFFERSPDDRVQSALFILHSPRVRELLEAALVLLRMPEDKLASLINAYAPVEIAPTAIALYRDVFFDVRSVAHAQLKVLVAARVRLMLQRAIGAPEDEAAVNEALASDPRVAALSMPAHPFALFSILTAAGWSPKVPGWGEYFRFADEVIQVGLSDSLLRGDVRRANTYLELLARVNSARAARVPADSLLVQGLAAFTLRHSDEPLMTVQEMRARGDRISDDPHTMATDRLDLYRGSGRSPT